MLQEQDSTIKVEEKKEREEIKTDDVVGIVFRRIEEFEITMERIEMKLGKAS